MKINFELNGVETSIDTDSKRRVVDILRYDLGLTGTKEGCGSGECGACSIMVNGESRLSCLMLAPQLDGQKITTIEGISNGEALSPIQEGFAKHGAVQCGFCTPGMVIAASDLLIRNYSPSRDNIRQGISGNLCRCTGYHKIVNAIEEVSKNGSSKDSLPKKSSKVDKSKKSKSDVKSFLPETVEDLQEIMSQQKDAIIFCGGTDLFVKLRKGIINRNAHFVSLDRVKELKTIKESEDKVFIGACSTIQEILDNQIVRKNFPIIVDSFKNLGSPPIRHMATIGGNICTASPAGDTLPSLYLLDAEVEIADCKSNKILPIKNFIIAPAKTSLRESEILIGVWLPKKSFNLSYYEKVGQRNSLSISIVSFAALGNISKDNKILDIRLAWGSVAPTVVRVEEIEEKLRGLEFEPKSFTEIVPLIDRYISPINDIRASEDYRRAVSKNLVYRLFNQY